MSNGRFEGMLNVAYFPGSYDVDVKCCNTCRAMFLQFDSIQAVKCLDV